SEDNTKRLKKEADKCHEEQKRETGVTSGLPEDLTLKDPPAQALHGSLSLSGPSNVTGTVGGSLSVQCRYEEEYRTFTKYWCRQPCLPLWQQIVETTESETEVRRGQVSIMDHTEDLTFTVTLENLTADDTGKYRCGIATILREEGLQGFLPDPFFQVQVFVFPVVKESERISAEHPRKFRLGRELGPASLLSSVHFLLLISLKVPLLLIMLSAVLWVNRPQRSQPDQDNLRPSLPIHILSRDTAAQTREEGISDPEPYIFFHLIARDFKNKLLFDSEWSWHWDGHHGAIPVCVQYEEEFKANSKYRCRNPCWALRKKIVATKRPKRESRSGCVSIRDYLKDLPQ
ncbi:hypothetical protein HPG69_006053, partial [Diceros bicornis minor]